MKKISRKTLSIHGETLRVLSGARLHAAKGGRINSLTGCEPCHPSDGIPGHCNTDKQLPGHRSEHRCTISVGA